MEEMDKQRRQSPIDLRELPSKEARLAEYEISPLIPMMFWMTLGSLAGLFWGWIIWGVIL